MFRKYKQFIFPGVGILLILILGYFSFLSSSKKEVASYNIEISGEEHTKGNPNAKVTLVEYSDFECPACGAYSLLVKELLNDFPNDLRVIYRHFPLTSIHKNAEPAAYAAEAAGQQGKFWEMHDKLFPSQEEWSNLLDPKDKFLEYAASLGLDKDQFLADYQSPEIEAKIKNDSASALDFGLNSTPTFFVNNRKIELPQNYEDFKEIINDAIGN